MTKKLRMLLIPALMSGLALGTTGCKADLGPKYEAGNPVKIGLICLHDNSSTYDKNFIDSMAAAVANLGDRVAGDAIIKTGVDESKDAYDAAKDLVKQGCNVIFADSFGHEPFILEAAQQYKNVQFCHATGTTAKVKDVANFHNAFASIYEGRYLAGYAAGLKLQAMVAGGQIDATKNMTADGKIKLGYVGAFPYAEVVSGYTSWFLGVREVVPNVVMNVTFTSSWYDFNAEKDGAKTLIDWGAAIVSQHADSMGAPGECETRGVPNVTYNVSTAEDCPNTYLAYSKINWAPYYEEVVNAMFEGRAIAEVNHNYTGTLATGSVVYDVKDPVAKAACEVIKGQLEDGSRKVFDCSKFTVNGQHLTEYLADVDDYGDFVPETNAIKTEGDITFFDESALRSAPYFNVDIDGITKLNA